MAYRKKLQKSRMKDDLMAVPQFGGWDKKTGTPDYSMVFSRARANRKYQKSGARPASLGNESDLLTRANRNYQIQKSAGARPASFGNEFDLLTSRQYDDDEPVTFKKKKKLLRYLCCIMV